MTCYDSIRKLKEKGALIVIPQIENEIRRHTLVETFVYHLLPGALIGAVYYFIVPFIKAAGYPSVMALIFTAIIVLLPVELGTLFWHGKRKNGKLSLKGVVLYCQKLSWGQVALWILVIFVISGSIMTVLNPVSAFIQGWFLWIPDHLQLGMGFSETFSRGKLVQTYALHFVFIVLIAPAIEEIYFRGFLLPRMPEKLDRFAPIFHSLLFALYHVWSP